MSPHESPPSGPEISPDRVYAFRLAHHHLLDRTRSPQFVRVAGEVGGIQAQVLSAAETSLWARSRPTSSEQIEVALSTERTLVRATAMRSTLYLLPSHEVARFARGCVGRVDRELTWLRNRGVSLARIEEILSATLGALDEPKTRGEVADRVARTLRVRRTTMPGGGWGGRSAVPAVRVGGLTLPGGYLVSLAGARGVVCRGPPREHEPTFVRAERWVGGFRDVSIREGEEWLARRYLHAFGPSTAADLAWWVGWRGRHAAAVWERLGDAVAPVQVKGAAAGVLRSELHELETTDPEATCVRLLPYFDAFVLGHQLRDHLMEPRHFPRVYRAQGWVAPVVLVAGRVVGTWSHRTEGGRLVLALQPFGRWSLPVGRAVREEADSLAAFLGCPGAAIVERRRVAPVLKPPSSPTSPGARAD